MASSGKRATHVEQDGPVLEWRKPPKRFRWMHWQDIVALVGFAIAVGVFTVLLLWGMSSGAFNG